MALFSRSLDLAMLGVDVWCWSRWRWNAASDDLSEVERAATAERKQEGAWREEPKATTTMEHMAYMAWRFLCHLIAGWGEVAADSLPSSLLVPLHSVLAIWNVRRPVTAPLFRLNANGRRAVTCPIQRLPFSRLLLPSLPFRPLLSQPIPADLPPIPLHHLPPPVLLLPIPLPRMQERAPFGRALPPVPTEMIHANREARRAAAVAFHGAVAEVGLAVLFAGTADRVAPLGQGRGGGSNGDVGCRGRGGGCFAAGGARALVRWDVGVCSRSGERAKRVGDGSGRRRRRGTAGILRRR